jgi:cytochrome c peroxidase
MMACEDNELHQQLDEELTQLINGTGNSLDFYTFPDSDDFSNIPQDPNNPISAEKVALGQLLYHETGLALNARQPQAINTYSCASCHFSGAGFQANVIQGLSDGGEGFGINGEARVKSAAYDEAEVDAQAIRTPTVLNCAYQKNMLWNGQFGATGANTGTENLWTPGTPKFFNTWGYEGIEIQSIASMGVHRIEIDTNDLITTTEYKAMFDVAFPNIPATERYTREYGGLAIAAFERTILAQEAPFQKWLKGDSKALTTDQKKGAVLFFGKGGCIDCHNSPALNDMDFHVLGMKNLYEETEISTFRAYPISAENYGRGGFTGKPEDFNAFKTPQLYNLKDSKFYGHGGSFRSVEEIIRYKNLAIPESNIDTTYLSPYFIPLGLTDEEILQLVDFIENGLHDPNLKRYEPASLPSGLCFPNNDAISRSDLGCN